MLNLKTPNGYELNGLRFDISKIVRSTNPNGRNLYTDEWYLTIQGYHICSGTKEYCNKILQDIQSGHRFLRKGLYASLEMFGRS